MEKELIKDYLNGNSIYDICDKYHIGKLKIIRVLEINQDLLFFLIFIKKTVMKYIQRKPTQLIRGGCKLNTQNIVGDIIKSRSKQLVHRHSVIKHVEVKNTVDETVKKIFFDYYKNKINVCMTSWVKRIHLVPNVIKNMLKQTIKPKMIWLTLSSDEFVDKTIIPQELFDLEKENENFTIHWVKENTKTMKKVFPVLPFIDDDDLIFLMDDDFLPHNDIIESRLIDFCNYGGNYCVSSYTRDGVWNDFFGFGITSCAPTSLLLKNSLNGYEKFINEDIINTFHDDETYMVLAYLNGYKFKYAKNYHWMSYEFKEQHNGASNTHLYDFKKARQTLNNRVNQQFGCELKFIVNRIVDWNKMVLVNYSFNAKKIRHNNFNILNSECVIVIPIYKNCNLTSYEIASLKRVFEVFYGKYNIFFIRPKFIDMSFYEDILYGYQFSELIIDNKWFENQLAYANLCLVQEFYDSFIEYKYMFIYQLDAWVNEDKLDYFCKMNYDFYGAWLHDKNSMNGGACLRNIVKCRDACIKYNPYNRLIDLIGFDIAEDRFFPNLLEFNPCPKNVADEFSIQNDCFFNDGKVPFCFHYFCENVFKNKVINNYAIKQIKKRYTILTYIFNDYEIVHEIENPQFDVEYILVTDNKNLFSNSWNVAYDEGLEKFSALEKCYRVRFNCFKYCSTDICLRVDSSIIINDSLDGLINEFINGDYDCALMLHPYRYNFKEEYSAWCEERGYPKEQMKKCIGYMETNDYDFEYKSLFQLTVSLTKRTNLTHKIDRITFNLLKKLGDYNEFERIDQIIFSYIINTKFKNLKVMPLSEQIIHSRCMKWCFHKTNVQINRSFDNNEFYMFNKLTKAYTL